MAGAYRTGSPPAEGRTGRRPDDGTPARWSAYSVLVLRRILGTTKLLMRSPDRIGSLERRTDALELGRSEQRREIDLAFGVARRRADEAETTAIAAARAHTEASVLASQEQAVGIARAHAEAAATAVGADMLVASREHAEAIAEMLRAELLAEVAQLRRDLRAQKRVERSPTVPEPLREVRASPSMPATQAQRVDEAFYVALEDRFRGSPEVIADRQRVYVDLVRPIADDAHPVLDLGSGRGEWLRVLGDASIAAIGVDNNRVFVDESSEAGLDVRQADLLEFLCQRADGSVGAVTMFQVVEHLELAVLLSVLDESARVLRPGGVLIAETPNALNARVASANFWIDPTHVRPLHPEFLRFCASYCGFTRTDGLFLNDLDGGFRTIEDPHVRRLAEQFDGPGDFTLTAWR